MLCHLRTSLKLSLMTVFIIPLCFGHTIPTEKELAESQGYANQSLDIPSLFAANSLMSNSQLVDELHHETGYSKDRIEAAVAKLTASQTSSLKDYFIETKGYQSDSSPPPGVKVESQGDHVLYYLASGFPRNHFDFPDDYVTVKKTLFQNFHYPPEEWPNKIVDMLTHNDEWGTGTHAVGACCSKTLGSFGKPGLIVHSLKVIGFEGRTDPFCNGRAYDFIVEDIKKNGYKTSTILYFPTIERDIYYWFFGWWTRQAERTVRRIREEIPGHESLMIFPAGDDRRDLDRCQMSKFFKRMASNDNILLVSGRDRSWVKFKAEADSNHGGPETVNLYGPATRIITYRHTPTVWPPRTPPIPHLKVTSTAMASSVIAGEAARLFSESDMTGKQVKDKLIEMYDTNANTSEKWFECKAFIGGHCFDYFDPFDPQE